MLMNDDLFSVYLAALIDLPLHTRIELVGGDSFAAYLEALIDISF